MKPKKKIFIPYSDLLREAMLRDYPNDLVRKFPMGHSGVPEGHRRHRYSKKIRPRGKR